MEEKKGMTAEEKEAQIKKSVLETEGAPLTQEEEYQIIANKGIEYKAGDLTLYIKAMMINDFDALYEIEEINKDAALSRVQKIKSIIEKLAPILGIELADLKKNLDLNDVTKIITLLSYSLLNGRRIFEKKKIVAGVDL
jgi:hypothetical protein